MRRIVKAGEVSPRLSDDASLQLPPQRVELSSPASQAPEASEGYPAQVIDEAACKPKVIPVQPVTDKAR